MQKYEHFFTEDWVDFVRGVAESGDAMQEHLDGGCKECTELLATFKAVAEIASRDRQYEPDESTMRHARAAFDRTKPSGALARAAQAMKVLFDSQLMPAPVGVRTAVSTAPRRVVYEAGDLIVDLQVGRSAAANVLIGQITAPLRTRHSVQGTDVQLQRGVRVLATGTTNKLGEFQFEFDDASADLTLVLRSDEDVTLIPLGTLTTRTSPS
jgi:hypothetical protein